MRLKSAVFISILFALIFNINQAEAQSPEYTIPDNPRTIDRLVIGGSLGLALGNVTNIELMPLIGYRLSNRFAVLAGPMYSYYHDSYYDYSDNSYGARAMARFFPLNSIYLQAESDWYSYGVKSAPSRKQYTYMMAGAGIHSGGTTFEVLYILNNPANTRYVNPFILRFGMAIPLSYL